MRPNSVGNKCNHTAMQVGIGIGTNRKHGFLHCIYIMSSFMRLGLVWPDPVPGKGLRHCNRVA